MSDYPMLISNKLHSFRNFMLQKYKKISVKSPFDRKLASFTARPDTTGRRSAVKSSFLGIAPTDNPF